MRVQRDRHASVGQRGRTSARWRGATVVGAATLALAAGAVPASAAGGYTVTATIPVGSSPIGVAVDPAARTAYVTNFGGDTVAVIDEATRTVTATIPVGSTPDGVAVDPAARTAYVVNFGGDTVSVIDEATRTVTATIPVGSTPDGVAVDPAARTAYVVNDGGDTVSVIDEATRTVTATIPVGSEPIAVAVDPAARTAYVTNAGDGTVSVISAATRTVTATIPVGHDPWGVAVDPATHTVYVTNAGDGTVSVIDEATRTVTATVSVRYRPVAVAVDPAARTAYVTNAGDGTVSVIDEATRTVTATIPVGGDPDGAAVDSAARTAYVANASDGTVSVISAARPAPVTTVTSSQNPSPFGRNVTFTATVGPADGGTITFSSGSTTLCRAVSLTHVSGRTYQATCTRALPAGRDTITAAYPGDASYATSAGTLTQTVTRARTALTVSISFIPRLAFTLTATLTASGRPLSGQPVSFNTGHTHLCTRDTSSRGVATCVLTASEARRAAQDNGLIRASYPGNTSYQPSSATAVPPLGGGPDFSQLRRPVGQRAVRSTNEYATV